MEALLKEDFTGTIGDWPYRFCDAKDCDVVYFSDDRAFTKDQLRVAVGVKERHGERPLCYCFGHSVASIKNELVATGRTTAPDDIRVKMEDPGCRCETENPSGSCCLGSVAQGVKTAMEELAMQDSDLTTPATPTSERSSRVETATRVAAVASSIVASACCWLPLALLAFGISGAGIAATLETYRPLFIAISLAFIAAAFWLTYRPRKAATGGHGCRSPQAAETESCCAPGGNRRFGMVAMNKVMLWCVTVLALVFLFFPHCMGALLRNRGKACTFVETGGSPSSASCDVDCCSLPPAAEKGTTEAIDPSRQIVFEVHGLTCPAVRGIGCGHRLAPVLEHLDRIDGVEACAANHTGTMLRFTLNPSSDLDHVAAIVQKTLHTDGWQPARVEGSGLLKALTSETWRGRERIRELSAIEFRQLAVRRIEAFTEDEHLKDNVARKLVAMGEEEWDRLAEIVETRDATRSPRATDWKAVATSFAKALRERAREVLDGDELDRLDKMFADRIERLPSANAEPTGLTGGKKTGK